MDKSKKILLSVLGGAVCLTALYYTALLSIPHFVDLNKYKDYFSAQAEKQTGFKISCEDIRFQKSFSHGLKVKLYHTIVLYPDDEIFLKLKESELKIKIFPLLFKKIVIQDAKLTRPIINITLYKDFSTSIEKYFNPNIKLNTNGYSLDKIINDTNCEKYKIKINDETTGKTFSVEGDKLTIKDIKVNESAHIILQGILSDGQSEYLKYDLDLLTPFNTEKQHFKFSPFEAIYNSAIKGEITGNLNLLKKGAYKGKININNLSLKAEDIISENNNFSIELNGEEINFNSSLHSSKSDSVNAGGKFNIGNKKYLDLNTNAKNINLANMYKIISVICRSINVQNPLKEFTIKGTLDADFKINSDFKKLKSSGRAKIINASISHVSLPYKINSINSNINFENNKINIEQAQAEVNATPIKLSGEINENMSVNINANSDNLDLNNLIKLFDLGNNIPINILSGKLSFNSNIKGIINKSLNADTNIILHNLNFTDNKYKIPVNIKELNTNISTDKKKYKGEALCKGITSNLNKKPIKLENLKIIFDDKKINIPQSTINIINSPIKISADIINYMKAPVTNLTFTGDIKSSDAAELIKPYFNEPHKATGILKTNGIVNITENKPKAKIQIHADKNNYLSYAVIKELLNKPSVLNIDFESDNEILNIKDLSLSEYGNGVKTSDKSKNILYAVGKIIPSQDFKLNDFKITIPDSLTASTNFIGGEEFSLKGSIVANNTIKSPELKGNIKVHYYHIKKLLTAIKNAEIALSSDNIRIIAPDIQVNTSKLNVLADINAHQTSFIDINNLQLNCVNLDLNSLYPIIEKNINPFAKEFIHVKKGSATINNFTVGDIKANDISSDFTFDKNILKIKNISARAYNGFITGNINYDVPHNNYELNLKGSKVSMKESLYDLCKLSDNISGIADFDASLSFVSGSEENILRSLNGKVDFTSQNGRMGTLGKFEYYLQAQNILYRGLLNTTLNHIITALSKDNTAHYVNAEGTVLFQNGYMIINKLHTTGKDMSLYITGKQNILTNLTNIEIYGRISDGIKRKLGSFGDVSISELISGANTKKQNDILVVNNNIINEIPPLKYQTENKTNTFKVNIYGDLNSLNAIKEFVWIIPKDIPQETNTDSTAPETPTTEENTALPDFNDL